MRVAIVKDAMTNFESDSETGAGKFLVVGENAPFNRVETTMALDGRATLASSAHFNGSTHRNNEQLNAVKNYMVLQYSANLASSAHLNGPFNTTQQNAEGSAIL